MTALLRLDLALFRAVNAAHAPWADRLFAAVTQLGQGWVCGLLLLAGILLRVPRQARWRTIALSAAAMLSTSLATNVVKRVVGRFRPERYFADPAAAVPGFQVHVVGPLLRYNSFPSGHASAAFCAATLAAVLFGKRWWPLYLVAAAVAWSRVYVGAHFPLDTLAGAALGTGVALAFSPALSRTPGRGPET